MRYSLKKLSKQTLLFASPFKIYVCKSKIAPKFYTKYDLFTIKRHYYVRPQQDNLFCHTLYKVHLKHQEYLFLRK